MYPQHDYEDYNKDLAMHALEKDEQREKKQEERDKEKNKAIKKTKNFTIVEYSPNNWTLENLAQEISTQVYNHFILFDHKGNIETDNLEALNALSKKEVNGSIYIDGQPFIVTGGPQICRKYLHKVLLYGVCSQITADFSSAAIPYKLDTMHQIKI